MMSNLIKIRSDVCRHLVHLSLTQKKYVEVIGNFLTGHSYLLFSNSVIPGKIK